MKKEYKFGNAGNLAVFKRDKWVQQYCPHQRESTTFGQKPCGLWCPCVKEEVNKLSSSVSTCGQYYYNTSEAEDNQPDLPLKA